MNKQLLATCIVLATLGGCADPLYDTYRDQPLVAKVDKGMSKQQVLSIAGQPASQSTRTERPGSCLDYRLTHANQQQPYAVSFDAADKVDHTGFMTCAQWSAKQRDDKESITSGGGGGY
ncbi:osmotically-inducible lipoprotein OsmE [Pseudomonas akapageensis]|uniref:osmotically-inducible lipoprotein OsmE n=1 Tax=Pseudomonas akapageensis TaxID=2609961 RepID=UPI0014078A75|nr:osmotically-inducible lipoprotein OsmE [Pseudomonas akapageensis]